jgi:hypothetical protein
MDVFEIKTLIDITDTKVIRSNQGSQLAYDQCRNFITLRQCLELRSIIFYNNGPEVEEIDIKNLGFGSNYLGKHKVWTFQFSPDRSDVYTNEDGDPIANIENDLDAVPIIKNLTETVNIDKAMFNCKNPSLKNTIIKARKGTF